MEIDNIFVGQVYKVNHVSNENVFTSHREYATILYQEENGYFDIKSEQIVSDIANLTCPNTGDLYIDSTCLIPYHHFSFSWSNEDTKTLEELQNNLKELNEKQKQYTL